MASSPTVAIDLGTAYTRIGVHDGRAWKIITDDHGKWAFPSYVAFTDSGVLVGEAAMVQASENPTNTVFNIIRLLGRRYSDSSVQSDIEFLPFKVSAGPDGKAMIVVEYKGKLWQFTPEEICSMIIKHMKDIAETFLCCNIINAVVAIPTYFNHMQRQAVMQAGAIAGLHIQQLINAPTAAALFYGFDKLTEIPSIVSRIPYCNSEYHVLIFDLGAGTLNVSLVNIKAGTCRVVASAGDVQLGGQDFDNKLTNHFLTLIRKKSKREISSNASAMSKLRIVSENVKISLSSMDSVPVESVPLCDDVNIQTTMTKTKFQTLIKDLIYSCIETMEKCLKDARVHKSRVNDVILVGGNTRIPLMQELLSKYFDGKKLYIDDDQDVAATYGASYQASILSGEVNMNVRRISLIDVTSFSLGIENTRGGMTTLVPRNTSIPSKTDKCLNTFHYIVNSQNFLVRVYEGEGKYGRENNLLGTFELTGILPAYRSSLVNVCFSINENGVLEVTAEEVTTGLKNDITISIRNISSEAIHDSMSRVHQAFIYQEEAKECAKIAADASSLENKLAVDSMKGEPETFIYEEGIKECAKIDGDKTIKPSSSLERKPTSSLERKRSKLFGVVKRVVSQIPQLEELDDSAVGIDLGTTYSCVGVWKRDRVEIIENEYGERTTRSCVAFTDAGRLIGDAAKQNQGITNQTSVIFNVKRLIGKYHSDLSTQGDMKLWPFSVVAGPGERPVIEVLYKGEKKLFAAEEVSSMILTKMKEIAQNYLHSEVKNAVVAVPACFSYSQRQAIKDAGLIAGFQMIQIINESTAAAIAYYSQKTGPENFAEKNLLFFDLGGGFLDVSIISISKGAIKVKAVAGDTNLGGEDFDSNMVDHFVQVFLKNTGKDISNMPRALRKLRAACERAKRILSTNFQTTIDIDGLHDGIDFSTIIKRDDFEFLNMQLIHRCMELVGKCLADAYMDKNNIHDIILVGGSTRIPKLQEQIQAFFNGKEICKSINPDEAVAIGATFQAAILTSKKEKKKFHNLEIHDVTTVSLGIGTTGAVMNNLIPRNTMIPTIKELIFFTCTDNQTSMSLDIYECELARTGNNNGLLAKFTLSGISPQPKGVSRISVFLDISADCTLSVRAHEMTNGQNKEITIIEESNGVREEEIKKMVQRAETYKAEDDKHKERAKMMNSLENYAYKIKDKLRTSAGSSDDQPLVTRVEEVINWLEDNHDPRTDEIEIRLKEFKDLYDELNKQKPVREQLYPTAEEGIN